MQLVSVKKAANILGITERHLRRKCSEGEITGAQKISGAWHLPAAYDSRLVGLVSGRGRKEDISALDVYSKPKRDAALRKLGAIREFEDFSAMWVRGGGLRTEAMAAFCEMAEMGASTLKRWLKAWREQGIEGLVDTRGGEVGIKGFSPQPAEMFESLYLDQKKPSIKTCLQTVEYYSKSHGLKWIIPSLRSVQKYVQNVMPLPMQVLHRDGRAAYDAKYSPYIESDPDSFAPGECWVGDHHQFDFWVRHRNRWIRPWVTAWMDYRSRKLVGYVISDSPNQTTILRAFGRGASVLGLPGKVKIDNGKDYDSEMWTGITKAKRIALKAGYIDEPMVAGLYGLMDISVSFSQPYHPQSKPIERLFATVATQFSKQIETYCGNNTISRPENIKDVLGSERAIQRAYDLESITELFEKYADVYNQSSHHGEGMNGLCPNTIFNSRENMRVVDPGALSLLMQVWSGKRTVGKNGIQFNHFNYGQYDPALAMYKGRDVRVAYDPDDITHISVYDLTTLKLVCVVGQNELVNIGDGGKVNEESMRKAQAAKARARRTVREYKPAAIVAASELAELTIDAQRALASGVDIKDPKNLQLVRTALDGQGATYAAAMRLKKAAGAESMSLELDFGAMKQGSQQVDLGLI